MSVWVKVYSITLVPIVTAPMTTRLARRIQIGGITLYAVCCLCNVSLMNTHLKYGIPSSRAYVDSLKFVNGLSGSSRLNTRMLTGWGRLIVILPVDKCIFDLYIIRKSPTQLLPPNSGERWCHISNCTVILTLIAACVQVLHVHRC